jgi:glycosyltransferase involved in cell wall biosynthesis
MAALAHGLPVVSTPSRVPTEHFREGENFEAVPFADASALAGRVAALLDDPARRERLAQGASALAGEFEWPKIAERTREFLLSVVKGQ